MCTTTKNRRLRPLAKSFSDSFREFLTPAVCLAKRRRPGKSVQGFQKALAQLPVTVLRAVAAGVRRRLLSLFDLTSDGWIVLGGDGSTMECPRVAELEKGLDPPLKKKGVPQVWVTA